MKNIIITGLCFTAAIALSACSTLKTVGSGRKAANVNEYVEVTKDIALSEDFIADSKFWVVTIRSTPKGPEIRHKISNIFATIRNFSIGNFCQIRAVTSKQAQQPILSAGNYELLNLEIDTYEKNGNVDFKTVSFKINSFSVDCYLHDENANINDVWSILSPLVNPL